MEEVYGIDKCAEAVEKPASTVEELNLVEKPAETVKLKDVMEDLEEKSKPTETMEELDDIDKPAETVEKPTGLMEEPDETGSPVETMEKATGKEEEVDNSAGTMEKPLGVVEELDETDMPIETMEKPSGIVEEPDEMGKPAETMEKLTEMVEELQKSDNPSETMEKSRRMIEELEGTGNQAETKSTETEKESVETSEKSAGFSYIIYQALGAIAVGVGGLVSSIAMGYTSPALPSMRADPNFNITEEQESWVGAVMPACGLLGSVAAGPLVDHMGRRATLLHLVWPFMLSWAMIATSEGVAGVLLGRMLGGFCVGVQTAAGSVLLPEIIQLDLRNTMFIFPAVLGTLGLLLSFAAGQYLTWRGLAWLGAALCLPILALLYPLPETPHHLTRTGMKKESTAALQQLRRTARDAELEQEEISSSCGRDSTNVSMWEIVQPPNLWPVSVAAALMLAQQTTGINAIVFFASTILEAGGGDMDSGTSSVLLGLVNFLGTFVGMIAVAKYKRRYLIAVSTVVLVASLLNLSIFFWAKEAGGIISDVAYTVSFVPVLALLAYMVGFSVAWGPIPWIFLGEGIPSRVRGKAVAVVAGVCWASTFLVTKTFGWSLASVGAHNTFLGYAVATAGSATLILRYMPETYGQSIAQMDKLYQDVANKKQQ